MIDPGLFTVQQLLDVFLDDCYGNHDTWRQCATIVPDYVPPRAKPGTRPICAVECMGSFLRHSKGPRQGHTWDMCGDDYQTPALALLALLEAPIPPKLIKMEAWEQARKVREAREARRAGGGK